MRRELEEVVRRRIESAIQKLTVDPVAHPRMAEAEIRERFLESWADFRHFGVESRAHLEPMRVVVRRMIDRAGEAVDITTHFEGTPLEVRPRA